MKISERLDRIRGQIEQAAVQSGRNPDEITLVAVSKTQPLSAIEEAYEAGQRHFGENYPQELELKSAALVHLPDLVWHFIGRLQRNKIKIPWRDAHWLHTIDRVELWESLVARADQFPHERPDAMPPLQCLMQINADNDPSKAGFVIDDVQKISDAIALHTSPRLVVCGAMTIPSVGGDPEHAFHILRNMAASCGLGRMLSMGMSGDFEKAIACGSTMVRVGTAIFGERG